MVAQGTNDASVLTGMRSTGKTMKLRIGTAGWQLPADLRPPGREHSVLEKYAELFIAVEVNSTHYKRHMPSTYARWAASVP